MRYRDYNSLCSKGSNLPNRGNLSKRDHFTTALDILKLDENKKKLLQAAIYDFPVTTCTLHYPWFGFFMSAYLFNFFFMYYTFNYESKKRNVVYVS